MSLIRRLTPLRSRLLVLLAFFGPGSITANVGNKAGGIATYSVAGARYGYRLLCMLALTGSLVNGRHLPGLPGA